ncbi:LuxR C-terminal-related transcriptional regulator [Amycolatopsis sp., V23-08]|uniref:LuxR C-terminal-related transcriptional regulator n=1 Tax=Amycolatopsis heterodermiae TaxID=3110235 RepID=A0ABU5RN62_9PSEU|nr:LuxR C-terminal-related transcriptional regulator [Amycolatopsis sp., V23-08]MEA5367757.1 LuxR C-terminal-related transcriptional regulator [Amycolatopsis sp., V23-08]
MYEYSHAERERDIAHCPTGLRNSPAWRAQQADRDARRLIADVREYDPQLVWGRLNRLGKEDPQRLMSMLVELAAKADLAILDEDGAPDWTRPIGGTAALQPDHATYVTPQTDAAAEREAAVVRLLRDGVRHSEIGLRTGASGHQINNIAHKYDLIRGPFDPTERDDEIARLTAKGLVAREIAAQLGINERTVTAARARVRARKEVETAEAAA